MALLDNSEPPRSGLGNGHHGTVSGTTRGSQGGILGIGNVKVTPQAEVDPVSYMEARRC